MDIQQALVSKTLAERAFDEIIKNGITEEFFPSPDHAAAFRWMQEYWQEHGVSPTGRAFKRNYPAYKLIRVEEPLSYLLAELREQLKRARVEEALLEATVLRQQEGIGADEVIALLDERLAQTHIETSQLQDMDVVASWSERWKRYQELKNLPGGMRGITLGLPSLDEVTSGAQQGQLITFVGEPKAGKSTLLLHAAKSAHEAGYAVLYVGFEMSNDEQAARLDAMIGGVDHSRLMMGKLSDVGEKRLRIRLRKYHRKNTKPFIMTQDIASATTVPGVQAKIQQYKPDIVFIDGVYMMDDTDTYVEKGTPQHLTNLTRALKRLGQHTHLPIVITTQVLTWKLPKKKAADRINGTGTTADAIGYSSSFAQDSDLVVAVEHTTIDTEKVVRIVLARNSARLWVRVIWDWSKGNFTELPQSGDFMGASDEDEEVEGEKDGGVRV